LLQKKSAAFFFLFCHAFLAQQINKWSQNGLKANIEKDYNKKELGVQGHKTFTLTTELQEQGVLEAGFEPATKGCLRLHAQSSANKVIFCYMNATI